MSLNWQFRASVHILEVVTTSQPHSCWNYLLYCVSIDGRHYTWHEDCDDCYCSGWIDSNIFMFLLLKRGTETSDRLLIFSTKLNLPSFLHFAFPSFIIIKSVFYFSSKCEDPHRCSLLSSVQVTPSFQPVKQTTCRTRVTARSRPAPASAQSTLCRLPGLRTGVTAAPGPALILLLALLQLLPQHLLRWLRAQRQHMHTQTLITTSPAQGKSLQLSLCDLSGWANPFRLKGERDIEICVSEITDQPGKNNQSTQLPPERNTFCLTLKLHDSLEIEIYLNVLNRFLISSYHTRTSTSVHTHTHIHTLKGRVSKYWRLGSDAQQLLIPPFKESEKDK